MRTALAFSWLEKPMSACADGGRNGIRTRDSQIINLVLYQLSYPILSILFRTHVRDRQCQTLPGDLHAAGQLIPRTTHTKRRRWESNPLEAALQAAARPPDISVLRVSLPGIEPGLRPSQSRVLSITLQGCSTLPRNRTSSDGFEDRHASSTPAGHRSA